MLVKFLANFQYASIITDLKDGVHLMINYLNPQEKKIS